MCPVGAVSKMTWSKPAVVVGSAKQARELVERRDLDRARARELFLDARHGARRQQRSIRTDHALAIRVRRGFRVDVQRGQAGHARDGVSARRKRHAEHLVQVRRRVGATRAARDGPASASATAVAQASEVLPTPPLPVKKRMRVGSNGSVVISSIRIQACSSRPRSRDECEAWPRGCRPRGRRASRARHAADTPRGRRFRR